MQFVSSINICKMFNPVSLDKLLLSSVRPVTLDKCYIHYILYLDLNFLIKNHNKNGRYVC